MIVLTVAPRSPSKQRETIRFVRDDGPFAWYCQDLKTGMQRVFTYQDWKIVAVGSFPDDATTIQEEDMAASTSVTGDCEAKTCERSAFVIVKHQSQYCDWALSVCQKHEQAARDRLVLHLKECPHASGAKYCYVCEERIELGELYMRMPGEQAEWVHDECLTKNGTDAKVPSAPKNNKRRSDMKDPVTKKAVKPHADDLPEDEEDELEPTGSKGSLNDDEEDEAEEPEDPRPARRTKPAAKAPAKPATRKEASKPVKSAAKAEKPATTAKSEKVVAKAKAATAKPKDEKPSRATGEDKPNGDTTIMRLVRGKGGEIHVRLNSSVVAQFQAATKNKDALAILKRARYWVKITSEDEADTLIAAATKIIEAPGTRPQFAKALEKFAANIDRWIKEIRKF